MDQPVPWIKIHCHGGTEVVRLLEALFVARGIKVCDWTHFYQVTTGDRPRSLAAKALTEALTTRTAGILLDQYGGALRQAVEGILDAWREGSNERAGSLLRDLASRVGVGRHLTVPWRVVVAGAPNVGKSSLVNVLAGYQRCVVAPTPGTTRDVVHIVIAIDGWPVELADTAGIREVAASIEQQGIALARTAALGADLCLWVLDASAEPVWPDLPGKVTKIVVNKVDLPPAWDLDKAAGAPRVSAVTEGGVEDLCRELARWLVPEPPPAGAGVPFTSALCDGVETAWQHYVWGRMIESRAALEALLDHFAM